MGLFDFLKPITSGISDAASSAGSFLGGINTPTVNLTQNPPLSGDVGPQAPSAPQAPPLTGDAVPDMATPAPGITRAAPFQVDGPIQGPPQGTVTPGFLDRMRAPDDSGVSNVDRLMAIGQVMQGDSTGALAGIQGARQNYRQSQLDQANKANLTAKSAAFKNAFDPATGKFDMAKYAGGLANTPGAFDADEATHMQNAFRHQVQTMSGPNGSIYAVDTYGDTPKATQLVEGQAKPDGMLTTDENGNTTVNPAWLLAQGQLARLRASATAAYRAPRAGAGAKPKSYGAGDVTWK